MYEEEEGEYRQLRLKEAAFKAESARLRIIYEREQLRPSMMLYTVLTREGGNWKCLHPSSEDELECPVAYGESPDQAQRNFDNLWMGVGLDIDPDDPDNQDSELEDM